MDPKLIRFCSENNIPIDTERSALGSYIWDGKSIAALTHHWNEWENKYDVQYFSYSFILHEIAHYLVASEYQRSLPEYGLDQYYLKRGEIISGVLPKKQQKYLEKKARIKTYKLENLLNNASSKVSS